MTINSQTLETNQQTQQIPMKSSSMPDSTHGDLSSLLKIISEPNRLRILESIIQGVQCNCELGSELEIAPNLISHHLSVLRDAGLIDTQRDPFDGRWIYYSINIEKLEEIRTLLNQFFNPHRIQPRQRTCGPNFPQNSNKV